MGLAALSPGGRRRKKPPNENSTGPKGIFPADMGKWLPLRLIAAVVRQSKTEIKRFFISELSSAVLARHLLGTSVSKRGAPHNAGGSCLPACFYRKPENVTSDNNQVLLSTAASVSRPKLPSGLCEDAPVPHKGFRLITAGSTLLKLQQRYLGASR